MMETLASYLKEKGARKVTRVKIKVGKLSGVEPELLKSAFDIIKRGTFASDAEMEMEIVPVRVKCLKCNHVFEPKNFVFICTRCGSPNCEVLEGEELILERIELEV
jgi:hydrogenase nickel incorporation protein HypA/HybF